MKQASQKPILFCGLCSLIGLAAGFYLGKSKPLGGTSAVAETQANVVTTVRTIKHTDGTRETTKQIVDHSVSASTLITAPPKHVVTVSATATVDYKDLRPVYGILLQKSLFADKLKTDRLQGGLGLSTNGQAMLTIGWSF